MCGRFSISILTIQKLQEHFNVVSPDLEWQPRYNIAPTQIVPIVISQDGSRRLIPMFWGLIPFWVKNKPQTYGMINSRSDTLASKPGYKFYLEKQRCLIPADGFYEWKKSGTNKIPYRAVLKNGDLFGMAGIWDYWPEKGIYSFSIITTDANPLIEPIHQRMPVIISYADEQKWLSAESKLAVLDLLKPFPAEEMKIYSVSSIVNSPKNDTPECIQPLF